MYPCQSYLLAEPIAAQDELAPVDEDGLDGRLVEQVRIPDRVDENVADNFQRLEEVLLGRKKLLVDRCSNTVFVVTDSSGYFEIICCYIWAACNVFT